MAGSRSRRHLAASAVAAALVVTSLGTSASAVAAEPAEPELETLTISSCERDALKLPDQTEAALGTTLLVSTWRGTGSAVVVSPDGFALTAAHVVTAGGTISVRTYGGAEGTAKVVRIDRAQDIALIKVDAELVTACAPLSESPAVIGADAFVLGSPGGEALSFSVAKGIVSGRREVEGLHFLQLDASVNPGNSGGPVVDERGEVVGITSWKVADVSVEGLAFAVPVDVARESLQFEFGVFSDEDWTPLTDAVLGASPPRPKLAPGEGEVSQTVRRRLQLRRGLIAAGTGTMIGGVMMVTVAGSIRANKGYTSRHEKPIKGAWVSGWVLTGLGAAAIIGGVFVRRATRSGGAKENKAAVAVAPFGRGVSLVGRF